MRKKEIFVYILVWPSSTGFEGFKAWLRSAFTCTAVVLINSALLRVRVNSAKAESLIKLILYRLVVSKYSKIYTSTKLRGAPYKTLLGEAACFNHSLCRKGHNQLKDK